MLKAYLLEDTCQSALLQEGEARNDALRVMWLRKATKGRMSCQKMPGMLDGGEMAQLRAGAVQRNREDVYVALQLCHESVLCVYVKCVKNMLLRGNSLKQWTFSIKTGPMQT